MPERNDASTSSQTPERDDPMHSFIIPAYNDSRFLEDCIRSLKQQTVPSAIIITTSTPSDFITALARKYNIEIKTNESKGGIAMDWNFAYRACKTKYLTLAHQDDVYLPEYTERCLYQAEKETNSDTLIVFTDYSELLTGKEKKTSLIVMVKKLLLFVFRIRNNYKNKFIKRSIVSFGNSISCPTVMFNTENTGSFEFSDKYRYNVDWEAWLRMARMEGRFIYINRKLMLHRIHSESETILQIKDNNRIIEEEMMFTLIWNKTNARLLMKLYRFGSKLNAKTLYKAL